MSAFVRHRAGPVPGRQGRWSPRSQEKLALRLRARHQRHPLLTMTEGGPAVVDTRWGTRRAHHPGDDPTQLSRGGTGLGVLAVSNPRGEQTPVVPCPWWKGVLRSVPGRPAPQTAPGGAQSPEGTLQAQGTSRPRAGLRVTLGTSSLPHGPPCGWRCPVAGGCPAAAGPAHRGHVPLTVRSEPLQGGPVPARGKLPLLRTRA